jgi:hypothetical protein
VNHHCAAPQEFCNEAGTCWNADEQENRYVD